MTLMHFVEMDVRRVNQMLEAERQRAPAVLGITSQDMPTRFRALRTFYRLADAEIQDAGRNEWGIDPYEVDWLAVFTPIEKALWHDIRAADAVLYPQYPVGRYFVDFGNPVAKVAVECDGAQFHQDKAKDAKRDADLRAMGWRVYRLPGRECIKDFDEETMEKSAPRKLIDELIERYGIGRSVAA